jgi:hypothetical protein
MKQEIAQDISRTALDMVATARQQLIDDGDDYEHDDALGAEELAVAAALFLLPADMNENIAWAEDNQLRVEPLLEHLAERTFDVFRKDDPLDGSDGGESNFDKRLDNRIDVVTEGLAMGLAELERLMRIREGLPSRCED